MSLGWRGWLDVLSFVDVVAVPKWLAIAVKNEREDKLFCFSVVLHLENVNIQCLFVASHVAEDDGLRFVKARICQRQ